MRSEFHWVGQYKEGRTELLSSKNKRSRKADARSSILKVDYFNWRCRDISGSIQSLNSKLLYKKCKEEIGQK
jgi:hypothetical protein